MIPWEGVSDFYRDMFYHGGMLCQAVDTWYRRTITTVQHGLGERSFRSAETGELVTGPETLTDEELAANRCDYGGGRPRPSAATTPSTESGPRTSTGSPCRSCRRGTGAERAGTCAATSRAFVRSASEQKWLEIHGLEHWTEFYTDYGVRSAEAVLRPLPQGRGQRLGRPAAGDAAGAHGRRRVHRPDRGRVADPADPSGRRCTWIRRPGTLHDRAARREDRRRAFAALDDTRASRC